jgi:uncharacterized protein (TIGR03437 family)
MRLCLPIAAGLAAASLFAQKPAFQPAGVQNAASQISLEQPAVTPGMILAIRGQNLAASTASAAASPLPQTPAGTSVTFDGAAAPLLYVSPDQINLQVPSAISLALATDIVVNTAAGPSDPVRARVRPGSFGAFTQDASGCGPGTPMELSG